VKRWPPGARGAPLSGQGPESVTSAQRDGFRDRFWPRVSANRYARHCAPMHQARRAAFCVLGRVGFRRRRRVGPRRDARWARCCGSV